ncbi:MAG: phosphopantetheine-binding protein [Acidobacteriota bacterium]
MQQQAPSPELSSIEARLLELIQRERMSLVDTVHRHDDLLSGEVLDSVAVLRLATCVEEEFNITVGPADFVVENFQNLEILAQYIQRSMAS